MMATNSQVVGRGAADVSKGGAHQRIDLMSNAFGAEELVGVIAFTVTAGTGGGGSPLAAGERSGLHPLRISPVRNFSEACFWVCGCVTLASKQTAASSDWT